jgi:hypothetical protein
MNIPLVRFLISPGVCTTGLCGLMKQNMTTPLDIATGPTHEPVQSGSELVEFDRRRCHGFVGLEDDIASIRPQR